MPVKNEFSEFGFVPDGPAGPSVAELTADDQLDTEFSEFGFVPDEAPVETIDRTVLAEGVPVIFDTSFDAGVDPLDIIDELASTEVTVADPTIDTPFPEPPGAITTGFTAAWKEAIRDKGNLPVVGHLYEAERFARLVAAGAYLTKFPTPPMLDETISPGPLRNSPAYLEMVKKQTTWLQHRKVAEQWIKDYEQAQAAPLTTGGQIAKGIVALPAFMTDFLLTGPVFRAVSAPTKAAATRLLQRAGVKVGAQLAGRLAGAVAGTAARTAVNVPALTAGTLEGLAPGFQITDEGKVLVQESKDTPMQAFYKTLGRNSVENFSEIAGRNLPLSQIMTRFPKLGMLVKGLKAEWLAKAGNKARLGGGSFMKFMEKVGYHGFIEEMEEEQLARVMNAVFGLEDVSHNQDDYFSNVVDAAWPSWQEVKVNAGVIAPLAVVGAAGRVVSGEGAPVAEQGEPPAVAPAEPSAAPEGTQEPKEPEQDLSRVFGDAAEVVTQFKEDQRLQVHGISAPIFGEVKAAELQAKEVGDLVEKALKTIPRLANIHDFDDMIADVSANAIEQISEQAITDPGAVAGVVFEAAASEVISRQKDTGKEKKPSITTLLTVLQATSPAIPKVRFSIDTVQTDRQKINDRGRPAVQQAAQAVDQYLSGIEPGPGDSLNLPDEVLASVVSDVAKQNSISQSEVISRLYARTIKKLSNPKDARGWLNTVNKIRAGLAADGKPISDSDFARMIMLGAKGTRFSPMRDLRAQLAKERQKPAGITQAPRGTVVGSDIVIGPRGQKISRFELLTDSGGMPDPVRNSVELSFQRMASNVSNVRGSAAWPLKGSKRPTGANADVIFEAPESFVVEVLTNPTGKPIKFKFQGEPIEILGSPLTSDQKAEIEILLEDANRLGLDPFRHVYDNFLSPWIADLGIARNPMELYWQQATEAMTEAATRLWEQREGQRVKDNPKLKEAGVTQKASGRWTAFVNFPGQGQRTILGTFDSKALALAARTRALVSRFGKDYTGFDLRSMPTVAAWASWSEELDRLQSPITEPGIPVRTDANIRPGQRRGDTHGTQLSQFLIEEHSQASYARKNSLISFRPRAFPAKPTRAEIIADKGLEWYNEHKDQNIKIVGQTYLDRDSGRFTHEIYSEGAGQSRTLAEEIYHPIFDIIRETDPVSFEEIRGWHAQRPQQSGQSVDEDFAQEMALVETYPKYKPELPRSVVKVAQAIFSGKKAVSQAVVDKVKASFGPPRFSVDADSVHNKAYVAALVRAQRAAAKAGTDHFLVQRPSGKRPLSTKERLELELDTAQGGTKAAENLKQANWAVQQTIPKTGSYTVVRPDGTAEWVRQASLTVEEARETTERIKAPPVTSKAEAIRAKFIQKIDDAISLRRELARFISASLPPSPERAQAMGRLARITAKSWDKTNIRNFGQALIYVDEMAGELRKKQAVTDFKDTLKFLKKTFGTKKTLLGEMRPEFAKPLNDIIESIDLSQMSDRKIGDLFSLNIKVKALIRAIGAANAGLADPDLLDENVVKLLEIPDDRLKELNRIGQKSLAEMTAEEIEAINFEIARVVSMNNLKNKILGEKENRDREEVLEQTITEIIPTKRAMKGKPPGKAGSIQQVTQFASATLPTHIQATTGSLDNTTAKILLWDVLDGLSAKYQMEKEIKAFAQAKMEKAGITHKVVAKWRKAEHKFKMNGKRFTLNEEQLVSILMDIRNPDNRTAAQRGYRWKESPLDRVGLGPFGRSNEFDTGELDFQKLGVLLTPMTDLHRKAADIANSILDEKTKKPLAETSVKLFNHDLFRVDKYWAINRIRPIHLDGQKSDIKALSNRGFTKERVGGVSGIWLTPFFSKLHNSIEESSAYAKMMIPIWNAKSILASRDWQVNMRDMGRTDEMAQIIARFLSLERASSSRDALALWSGQLIRGHARLNLALNAGSILAQLTSGPMLMDVDIEQYVKHPLLPLSKQIKDEIFAHNGLLWKRITGGRSSKDIGDVRATGAVDEYFFDKREALNKPMVLQSITDGMVVGKAWRMAKGHVENTDLKKGSPQYWDAVNRRVNELMLSQPQWEPVLRSELLTSEEMLTRGLMAFRSPVEAMHNAWLRASSDVTNKIPGGRTSQVMTAASIAASLVMYRAVKVAYRTTRNDLLPDLVGVKPDFGDDDEKRDPLEGVIEQLILDVVAISPQGKVVFGPLLKSVLGGYQKAWPGQSALEGMPIVSMAALADEVAYNIGSMARKKTDGDPNWDARMPDTIKGLITLVATYPGIPVGEPIRVVEKFIPGETLEEYIIRRQETLLFNAIQAAKKQSQELEDEILKAHEKGTQ